jgi:hypothetical protein
MEPLAQRYWDHIDRWLRLHAAPLLVDRPQGTLTRWDTALERHPEHPARLFKLAVTLAALDRLRDAGCALTKLFTLEHNKFPRTYVPLALQWEELAPLHDRLRDLREMLNAKPDIAAQ